MPHLPNVYGKAWLGDLTQLKAAALALAAMTFAYADDDDKDRPAAAVERVEAIMSILGCEGYEEVEVEGNSYIEIEDAKCEFGTMDIKLDPDGKIVLMSAY